MKRTFVVINKHVVRAPNIGHAKNLIFNGEGNGEILSETASVEEISEQEIMDYIGEKDEAYTQSSQVLMDEDEAPEDNSLEANSISNSRNEYLRSENKRLSRRVEVLKNTQEEVLLAVYSAAYDAFSGFEPMEIKKPRLKGGPGAPETAVAVFADWQLGKITPDYSSEVLAKRIELYTEKLLDITEMQREHHPVNDLHVWMLGDIVEGEEIFPGQSHLLDAGLYRQVGINGPSILQKFFDTALANFDHVYVTGVIGNHGAVGGQSRKLHDPETNMDRLLYKNMETFYKEGRREPRITFNIPDGRGERNWYAVVNIGNYSSLLIHGDQMPGPTTYYGYFKKVMGWKDGAIPENFEDVFMGHYHQQFKMTIGSSMLRISGSPESFNTYAQEYFSSMSRPCQHLMFVHPDNGITSEYSIWLD